MSRRHGPTPALSRTPAEPARRAPSLATRRATVSRGRATAALVVAHPGHELRVHGWLERNRPVVHVLTDGSGSVGRPRIESTRRLLERVGARPGCLFGRMSDRQLYEAILSRNYQCFYGLVDELTVAFRTEQVGVVAGDAAEGFNPGHDVTRLLVNAALQRLAAEGQRVLNLEFPLDNVRLLAASTPRAAQRLRLTEAEMERKLGAGRDYPEMAGEVASALARHGARAFRTEGLHPVGYGLSLEGRFVEPPAYERYGEDRVRNGVYRAVIRFREHLQPLAAALAERQAVPGPRP